MLELVRSGYRSATVTAPSARILAAFCSDIPLICSSNLLGLQLSDLYIAWTGLLTHVYATDSTV